MKQIFIEGIFFISLIILFSCNNEESVTGPQETAKVEIGQDNECAIQNFINQVNGMETKSVYYTDPTKDQVKMRMYAKGGVDCFDGNGSCLPDVIIISDLNTTWNQTKLGSELQKLVNDNKVTFRKDFNETSNTEFYIYNGINNKNSEIVVPVAYRNK